MMAGEAAIPGGLPAAVPDALPPAVPASPTEGACIAPALAASGALALPTAGAVWEAAPAAAPGLAERLRRLVARAGRRRLVLAGIAALAAGWALWEVCTWPDAAALVHRRPVTTAFIDEYRDAGWFRPPRPVEWRWVPYAQISPNLKRAVLSGEDLGFFSHHGFETREMRAALTDAWEEKRLPRGASTITQQLAKNLWLSPSRNPLRKLKEAALTRQLESHLSKRRILELYLNVVELGPGIYGAEAAARHYFGKPARALSEHEAAQLAGSLPLPEKWHPGADSRAYRRHVQTVLRRMAKAGWLSPLL
jgi:monofunctional biosynthetic peptidoglycan transglycosylase